MLIKTAQNPKPGQARNYSCTQINEFIYRLADENWNDTYNAAPNKAFDQFHTTLSEYFNTCFPKKKNHKHSQSKNQWITQHIKMISKNKKMLYDLTRQFPTSTSLKRSYPSYCKYVKKCVIDAKHKANNHTILSSSNKSRAAWKLINDTLGKNTSRQHCHTLTVDDTIITDKSKIANELNNYFVNVSSEFEIKPPNLNPDIARNIHTFFLYPTDKYEIIAIVRDLKNINSSGWDEIPIKVIKHAIDYLIEPLSYLINLSLSTGVFPQHLKHTIICPVFKKGDHCLMQNYRPIALLPTISKIYEKVVHSRLLNFLFKKQTTG